MLILKLLQQLVKALNSEGSPGQVAAGIALGSALGLTPLFNIHNLVIVAIAMLLNVSFAGVMLGWALFVPLGFALDPVFHAIGVQLLFESTGLTRTWTELYNAPVAPYTNFNNTVVLGSLLAWGILAVPVYFLARWSVTRYRATIFERLRRSRFVRAVQASKLYNLYRVIRAE